jgi:hypothetical protein
MEEGLIAGFNLALMAVAGGVILGAISIPIYAGLWFLRK